MLDAARSDAPAAYQSLYEALAGRVCGYLRAQGAREPEDLTSEVFLRVFNHLHDFVGREEQFRAWVFTIAHHVLVDERRRRSIRPQTAELPASMADTLAGGDAEHDALVRLASADVSSALEKLTPEQRDVLILRVLGDLSLDQVSRALGKRPGAIKATQRRALARLQRHFEETRA